MQQPHRRMQADDEPDPAWELVRRWPGLRGEDKLAWLFLWRHSRAGRQRVSVTPTDVAADQGVTSDAGRQRLKNLKGLDLIIVVRDERGVYLIELPDPRGVARARAIQCDPQLLLGFLEGYESQATSDAGNSPDNAPACDVVHMTGRQSPTAPGRLSPGLPAEDPPALPRRGSSGASSVAPTLETSERVRDKSLTSTSTLESLQTSRSNSALAKGRGNAGGSAGGRGSSVDRDEAIFLADAQRKRTEIQTDRPATTPPTLGLRLIALALERGCGDPVTYGHKLNELARELKQRVHCPQQYDGPCLKLADAVLAGAVKSADVERLFTNLDRCQREGTLRGARSQYFVGAARQLVERAGLAWNERPR